jgi:SAM-dependent methyltransferase
MTKTPDQWSAFDLAEAFHLSHAVAALHEIGVFAALKKPLNVKQLAAKYSLDVKLLGGLLEYVAARTDLLRKSGDHFISQPSYSPGTRFLLDLYIGTYGRNAAQIERLLSDPSRCAKLANRASYALAFSELDDAAAGFLPDIIRQLGLNHLLDLGCGSGALLLALAKTDSSFVGWGVDSNVVMCRATRARIRAVGLQKRLRIIHGDCRKLGSALPAGVTDSVAAVTACNVANEMFTHGQRSAVAWLLHLRKIFARRPLLVADYYGRLGHTTKSDSRETLLHDYAQLISGQGVPPADNKVWRSIYRRAGCQLVEIIEDKTTTRFIHIVRL